MKISSPEKWKIFWNNISTWLIQRFEQATWKFNVYSVLDIETHWHPNPFLRKDFYKLCFVIKSTIFVFSTEMLVLNALLFIQSYFSTLALQNCRRKLTLDSNKFSKFYSFLQELLWYHHFLFSSKALPHKKVTKSRFKYLLYLDNPFQKFSCNKKSK